MHFLLSLVLFINFIYATSLQSKYPSYSYVFNEFDIDKSYINEEPFLKFVNSHERSLKRFYKASLKRGKDILPTMQGLLLKDDISDLFVYISIVESGLKSNAISSKKAVGLWQFMPKSAKYYNLDISKGYDERCDTLCSTSAAIRYLRKLHKKFKKWYLAIMAYNCGEGRLQKAINKAGSDDLTILTNSRSKYLPKETREYINKIILMAMIGESSHIDFGSINYDREVIKVEVPSGVSLKKLAKELKMDTQILLSLNKSFKNGIVPKKKKIYKIVIPLDKVYEFYFLDNFNKIELKKKKLYMISHIVKLGDTLSSIAKSYSTTISEIKDANYLSDDYLVVGSILIVPVVKSIFDKVSK